jgi:hypothetical protein
MAMSRNREIRRLTAGDPHSRKVTAVVAAVLFIGLGHPIASNAADASPLTSFLLKPGEIGGFVPGKARVYRTASAIRSAYGKRPTKSEIRRFETEGFVEAATVRIHDRLEKSAEGFSSVAEFQTRTGAGEELKAEMKAQLNSKVRNTARGQYFVQRHFSVPGVSRVFGVVLQTNEMAAQLGIESAIANALFVEGNCLFAVAVYRPASKEVVASVITGIQAISRRSEGECP